ncbi:hypothetical protein VCHA53O466_40108 [Vibrio chagasii]|nr:hypothetical protein VCHA53O466_40108 [Vibrio chagasii]
MAERFDVKGLMEVLQLSVVGSVTVEEIQERAYSASDGRVLLDFRLQGELIDISVFENLKGIYVERFSGISRTTTNLSSMLRTIQSTIHKDEGWKESASRAFVKNRMIRSLTILSRRELKINKSNLVKVLSKLDGNESLMPLMIKAKNVKTAKVCVTEFGIEIDVKISSLNLYDFFPDDEDKDRFREVIAESEDAILKKIIFRDIGIPVGSDHPDVPKEIVEITE